MGKAPAERQQARRARLKLDNKNLLDYHKKDAERKKEKRLAIDATQLKAFRKRGKLRTRKWRMKLSTALHAENYPQTP